MRKKLILLSVLVAMSVGAKAQLERLTLGVAGGWTENEPIITMPTYADDMKFLKNSGSSFGVTAKYDITNWFAARADVLWVQKNYKMNRTNSGTATTTTTTCRCLSWRRCSLAIALRSSPMRDAMWATG